LRLEYTPGSKMHIADALSRAYLPSISEQDDELREDVNVMVHTLLHDFPASNKRLQEFRIETEKDAELSQLKLFIRNGFPPNTSSLSWSLKQFHKIASEIYEMDGLLFVHGKIIIPSSMRQVMQSIVHEGHLGIEKCKALKRQSMYWPGMTRDVEMTVSKCTVCNAHRKQQPSEPILPNAVPQRP
jgi:Integrase zinc binding domain